MASSSEDITVDPAPTTINPYEVLSLSTSATADEVKSAYRRAALKSHPDKAPDSEKAAAHAKFQDVAFAYAVLSDPRRRARYDATGRTEESLDLDGDDDFDWATFFRTQFAEVVTAERISAFAKEYKGSEEEREHLLASYTKGEGSMRRIYSEVMLSDVLEDEDRFREIIDRAIKDGEVEDYKKYSQESEKSRTARFNQARKIKERESKEAVEALAELEEKQQKNGTKETKERKGKKEDAGGDLGGLAAMIQKRQQSRAGASANFFDNLEAKYAPKGKKGTKRTADDEPSEEAFANNRARKVDHSKSKSRAAEATEDASNGSRRSKRSKT